MAPSLEIVTPRETAPKAELAEKAAVSNVVSLPTTGTHRGLKFELEDHPIDELPPIKVCKVCHPPRATSHTL